MGPLPEGTHTTTVFQPTLTYRVPQGWGNYEDLPGNFLLVPPGGALAGVDAGTSDYLGVYTAIQPETPACGPAPQIGGTAADIAAYFASHDGLETTVPEHVSVGGLHGVVLDLALAKDASTKLVCLIAGVPPSGLEHGVGPGLRMRLYLLDHHDPILGGTLAIEIDDVPGGGNHLDGYSSIVRTMHFGS